MGKSIFSAALSLVILTVASYASNVDVDVLPTPQNSNSIHHIIQSQKRYVLFNSRRLNGDCLPICVVEQEQKEADPTPEPVALPTKGPVPDPVPDPVPAPVPAPVPEPTSDCDCLVDDDTANTFKCGNMVYVCPGFENSICKNQESENSVYYKITDAQCAAMKKVELNTKCVPLPQYNIEATKDLSNRVCYDYVGHVGTKNDGKCEECTGITDPPYETLAPVPTDEPSESPTASPTESPTVSPSASPSESPSTSPSTSPSSSPSKTPVATRTTDCDCDAGDANIGSWKCGNYLYYCPDVEITNICSTQASNNPVYVPLNADECASMKSKEINESCITIPRLEINDVQGLGLSNRVCYDTANPFGVKTEEGSCGDPCKEGTPPPFINDEPSSSPSDSPSASPSSSPSASPSASPSSSPSASPSSSPSASPSVTSDCECDANDANIGSFKCGTKVYVCPGFETICSNQVKKELTHYPLTPEQCEEMKKIEIDEKCILLPEYGVDDDKGLESLSNRVCYDPTTGVASKTDSTACGGSCKGKNQSFTFKDPVRRRWFF